MQLSIMPEGTQVLFFLMFALVVFMIGLAKGGLGGNLGALATPMMALVMPVNKVIGLILPILMFADIFAVALHWGRWNRRMILLLLPGSVVGVTVATIFITNVPTQILQLGLGIIILVLAFYKLFEGRMLGILKYRKRDWHGVLAGTIAGFTSTLAHTGGPPISIYLLLQDVTPRIFIATSALYFMILNWIKVPYYFYAKLFDFQLLWQVAWLLPLVPLGVLIGKKMGDRINKQIYNRIIIVLLIVNALMLIFKQ
jgi:uncharacterized membrane protein YfcA